MVAWPRGRRQPHSPSPPFISGRPRSRPGDITDDDDDDDMLLLLLFALAALALGLAYAALRSRYAYWKRRGVIAPECTAPFGNYADAILGRAGMGDVMFDVYQKYRDQRYVGTHFLGTPLLQLHDPEIIRQVFVREFQDFNGRAMYSEPDKDMISGQLFMLSGQPWRNLRVKLSPTFTTGKLRLMFSTFKKCGDQLHEHIASQVRADGGRTHIDVKELLARFGTDIITSVAFGIDTNTLANPKSEFRRISGLILDPSVGMSVRAMLAFMWPNALRMLPTTLFPAEANEFFLNTVTELVEYREKHGVDRADMLQLLIKLKNDGFVPPDAPGQVADEKEAGGEESIADADVPVEKQRISIREIGAQCAVFFLAGFETTSATNTFALYLLAKHPEVQDKVVAEMREALDRHGGEITYDTLVNLPYTDMVLNETMRLYPAVPFLNREAMRERTLPLTDLVLDKGTRLMIPVRALHMDPKHWEHPEEFNPERFTKDKVEARHPMVYLPFGDGPRICIGMRMALIQMKMALMTILTRAEVALPADAPSTIKLSPHTITPTPVDTLKLVFTERAV